MQVNYTPSRMRHTLPIQFSQFGGMIPIQSFAPQVKVA